MNHDEYVKYDAIEIAKLIKRGEVKVREVLEVAVDRIERLNTKLNAVTCKLYDWALSWLDKADREAVLYGVPILLKDGLHDIEGTCSTLGSRLLKDYRAKRTSNFVKRLLDGGCIPLGKTNVPEFLLMGTTEPELFGPTRNPFNPEYSAGGSSGGSACSVACGMVPVATANDGGGSIRIPASMCGVFGFKPSRYFTPMGPEFFDIWMGLVSNHVITKSVRDSALFLDIEFGYDGPIKISRPVESFLKELDKPLEPLRIAFSTKSYFGKVDPEVVDATLKVAKMLEELGHRVEEKSLDVDFEKLYHSYIEAMFVEMSFLFDYLSEELGKRITLGDVETASFVLAKIGEKLPAKTCIKIKHLWDQTASSLSLFFREYDVYLTPTVADPHIKIGSIIPTKLEELALRIVSVLGLTGLIKPIVEAIALKQLNLFPFTQIANQAGLPAMSIPAGLSSRNIPIGVHMMMGYGKDSILLRLAKQLEETPVWFKPQIS